MIFLAALLGQEFSELGLFETLAKIRVESILNRVVSTTIDLLGDITPAIAVN